MKLLWAQRKNIQALMQANQMAMQGWQGLAQKGRNGQSVCEDNSTLHGNHEEGHHRKIFKAGRHCKKSVRKIHVNSQELIEIMQKQL